MSFIQTVQKSQCVKKIVIIIIKKCFRKFTNQDESNYYDNISFVTME